MIPDGAEREALLHDSIIATLLEKANIGRNNLELEGSYSQERAHEREQLYQVLKMRIETLGILNPSLESPAEEQYDNDEARDWIDTRERSSHEYFTELVKSRFPLAKTQLVERLGRLNWDRYNHVQKLRVTQNDPIVEENTKSLFRDSGIGSSVPAESVVASNPIQNLPQSRLEYAATVISSRAEASHKRLPSLPTQARSGTPFTCEICDRKVTIQRTREWK